MKATFICKFAPYVQWPPSAFASSGGAFTICVVGKDGVGELLDQAAAGERVDGRPIIVSHLQQATQQAGCQIVYLAGSVGDEARNSLDALEGTAVLTVADADRNPDAAVMIGFTLRENRVRFIVDQTRAEASGLAISSKLLGLAYSVRNLHQVRP